MTKPGDINCEERSKVIWVWKNMFFCPDAGISTSSEIGPFETMICLATFDYTSIQFQTESVRYWLTEQGLAWSG